MHAAALLALAPRIGSRTGVLTVASLLLVTGIVVFAGDLAARELLDHRLFPMAAPIGGGLMIAGWLAVAVGGLVSRR